MWTGFADEDRRLFPAEISIGEDHSTEYLWVQLVVEADAEDGEAVSIRRWFPESGHERTPNREQL
jgi:putative ATP-dependent endonuclease of OLD family